MVSRPVTGPKTATVTIYSLQTESSKNCHLAKAKFRYASWFEAGSKLVKDRFEACWRPASNLSATSFEPASNQLA